MTANKKQVQVPKWMLDALSIIPMLIEQPRMEHC